MFIAAKSNIYLQRKFRFYFNQLLSITHDIYKAFDCSYEVRGAFLDISKAFDKVWHDGIIVTLE